jgi:hypothetical protein
VGLLGSLFGHNCQNLGDVRFDGTVSSIPSAPPH